MTTPPKGALMVQLRLWALSEGADFCDKCDGIIWPELELVRCDFCWGEHGAPDLDKVKEAQKKHWKRIREHERQLSGECDDA